MEESLISSIMFAKYVSTDSNVRQSCGEATSKIQNWAIETAAREDLYKGTIYLLAVNPLKL